MLRVKIPNKSGKQEKDQKVSTSVLCRIGNILLSCMYSEQFADIDLQNVFKGEIKKVASFVVTRLSYLLKLNFKNLERSPNRKVKG